MLKKLLKILNKIKPKKRLYKYGTLGLSLYDDRTLKDKVNDFLCGLFIIKPKYNPMIFKSVNFRSFWDFQTNTTISSIEQIKERERAGQVLLKPHELSEHAKKAKKYKRDAHKAKIRKDLERMVREIHQGKSYARPIMGQTERKPIIGFNTKH